MNYSIIGYGKMGKSLEKIITSNNEKVVAIIDNEEDFFKQRGNFLKSDLAFEFSTPATAYKNLIHCFDNNIPVVCGTTGWLEKLPEIKLLCADEKKTLLYAPNFSIGMNVFMNITAKLTHLISQFGLYDISISETHHIHKKDIPSGTAIALQNIIKDNITDSNNTKNEIPITSIREGEIVGEHNIYYKSDVDIITFSHSAISREAFVSGAFLAAKWLLTTKKTGFFEFKDILGE
ncbi:MAG: 4-hydroxy-tetrahydrodipicolinate reductase [Bacteroidales bacterium]|nr:4-hydroxy-tetrahydrodipicolinate reductase [Bacteroidales bacterium]MDD2204398.1 4-hydroxy-tetrahydrodipicolinate reductase [Bacteroidales bacterium]MDD3913830.1 4-hydroxy-tetrahydrodipicolinate reductase [Bacteroidales bacterium]MDD4634329.1 4-hydroxy-tetrahydrodipicolinate reductase [Bacteroidales bacterium]